MVITGPSTTGPTGDELFDESGASLRSIEPPNGSGVTSANATGGVGGIGAFSFPTASATVTQDVQAYVASSTLNADGNVTILANATSSLTSYANSGSGGVIDVGEARLRDWNLRRKRIGVCRRIQRSWIV